MFRKHYNNLSFEYKNHKNNTKEKLQTLIV